MSGPQPPVALVERRVIVNADDFGQTQGINDGIIECVERGVVTSASLMVRWPFAEPAAQYARAHRALSVGLHIDLGEWEHRQGEWVPIYTVVTIEDAAAVEVEILAQLESFRRLVGENPTHLDSHQHAHYSDPAWSIVLELGARLGVSVRRRHGWVKHNGSFYGQHGRGDSADGGISVERFMAILKALPSGTSEVSCHPGLGDDAKGMYVVERAAEVTVLCDGRIRAAMAAEGISLVSYRDVQIRKRRTDTRAVPAQGVGGGILE